MGAILSFFSGETNAPIELDFDNAQPAQQDMQLWDHANVILQERGQASIEELESYEVATEIVRRAIEDPNSETECFGEVLGNIDKLHHFYELSTTVADLTKDVIVAIGRPLSQGEDLTNCAALCKKYTELIRFAVDWDFKKMMKSNLQNDLAFYRRCMDRQRANYDLAVDSDATTHMSMMLAQAQPMLMAITVKLQSENRHNPQVLVTVGKITNACRRLIITNSFGDVPSANYELCLKALGGSMCIYDSIADNGAFRSNSNFSAQKVVKCVAVSWPEKFPDKVAAANQIKSLIRFGAPNFMSDASSRMHDWVE